MTNTIQVKTSELRPGDQLQYVADQEDKVVSVTLPTDGSVVARVDVVRHLPRFGSVARPAFFYSGVDAMHEVIR